MRSSSWCREEEEEEQEEAGGREELLLLETKSSFKVFFSLFSCSEKISLLVQTHTNNTALPLQQQHRYHLYFTSIIIILHSLILLINKESTASVRPNERRGKITFKQSFLLPLKTHNSPPAAARRSAAPTQTPRDTPRDRH